MSADSPIYQISFPLRFSSTSTLHYETIFTFDHAVTVGWVESDNLRNNRQIKYNLILLEIYFQHSSNRETRSKLSKVDCAVSEIVTTLVASFERRTDLDKIRFCVVSTHEVRRGDEIL